MPVPSSRSSAGPSRKLSDRPKRGQRCADAGRLQPRAPGAPRFRQTNPESGADLVVGEAITLERGAEPVPEAGLALGLCVSCGGG